MAQRHSEYQRIDGDSYWTPAWVYAELLKVEDFVGYADPAPREANFDFLALDEIAPKILATNPPFKFAERFIRHALDLTKPDGRVAMLLPMTAPTPAVQLGDGLPPLLAFLERVGWSPADAEPDRRLDQIENLKRRTT